MKHCLLLLCLACLSACTTDTRWAYMTPQGPPVDTKRTPEGVTIREPSGTPPAGARLHWYGRSNAQGAAEGLGVLTFVSADGAQVTDSELGVMKSGCFEGTVYGNHLTGGRAIWRYVNGGKEELLTAWDNRFYQRPSGTGWEQRFPPIGELNQDWLGFARAEQKRRDDEEATANALAAKRRASGELSAGDILMLRILGLVGSAISNIGSGSGGSSSVAESSQVRPQNDYKSGRCSFDDKANEHAQDSGSNVIHVRIDGDTWEISYDFGGSHGYLIKGSGSLEGRTIEVLFENGRPVRARCSAGSGSCPVWKSYRQ